MIRNKPLAIVIHGVIPDDAPPEEAWTIASAQGAAGLLQEIGYDVEIMPLSLDLSSAVLKLKAAKPDIVFNLADSLGGSTLLSNIVPFLLDFLGVRYTGVNAIANVLANNKIWTKRVLSAHGISTPPWSSGDSGEDRPFDGPYIVKSEDEHASLGIDEHSVTNEWVEAVRVRSERERQYGGRWFIERFIVGREFTVPIVGPGTNPQVLPVAELPYSKIADPLRQFNSYAFKWDESDSVAAAKDTHVLDFHGPDLTLVERCKDTAIRSCRALDVTGFSRVDVRTDSSGQVWVLEVNSNPSLQFGDIPGRLLNCAKKAGLSGADIMRVIVDSSYSCAAFANPVL